MSHRHKLFRKVRHHTFGSAVEPGRDTLKERCDLSDFQWKIPFLREILQTFTAAAVHLGLRLAFASGLPYEAAAVIREVVDVCAQPRRIGFKQLKGQRLRWQLAGGLLSA
jgi:hypothetical protein